MRTSLKSYTRCQNLQITFYINNATEILIIIAIPVTTARVAFTNKMRTCAIDIAVSKLDRLSVCSPRHSC